MALKCNGSTGRLEYPGPVVTTYPYARAMWLAVDGSASGGQFPFGQSSTTASALQGCLFDANNYPYAYSKSVSYGSDSVKHSIAPQPNATLQLCIVAFTGGTSPSRTIYFGSNTPTSDTANVNHLLGSDNITTAGGWNYFSGNGSFNGSIAEDMFFDTTAWSGTTQIDALLAGNPGETITGFIDGWTYKDYNAGGTYTSIGGTRTMTAVGGVTQSSLTHPVTRTANAAPTFSGTIANIAGTGGSAITPVDVHTLFSDTDALTYSASPGGTAWPSGLVINSSTGVISGTAATSTTTGMKVRATDTAAQSVDSNAFSVTLSAPASTVTGVTVSPATATVTGGATQAFTATVAGTGSPSQTVNWATSAGSITSGGVLTVPATTTSVQTVTVTATSAQDGTQSGTATVTVPAGTSTVTSVTVSPSTATVAGGSTLSFNAAVAGAYSPSQSVTWSASAGTINSSGVFSAPASTSSSQSITVTATSTQDATKSGTASVTVPAVGGTSVTVTGPSAGGKHIFDGSVRAGVAYHVTCQDAATHALVATITGLTTPSSGVPTFTTTLLTSGTEYLFICTTDGNNHDIGFFFATPV